MNTIIEKIRAEVNRLQHTDIPHTDEWWDGADYVRRRMKDVLSDLEKSEKPINPVGDGLEEENKRWLKEGEITDTRYDDYDDNDIESTARHFAQWGAEHLKK